MSDVIVLGAGMVGIGTALALQARGKSVLLIDRRAPGEETSFGNAGIIQGEAVEPYGLPHRLSGLIAAAMGGDNQVDWRLTDLPIWAGPLWRYWRASQPARHAATSRHYARIIQSALADHGALIPAAGAEDLVARGGFRQIHRSGAGFEAAAATAERLARDYGVNSVAEDGATLARAEPALRIPLAGGIWWRDAWAVRDPGGLTAAYARLFQTRGGEIALGDAATLARGGAGWRVATDGGPQSAAEVVLALGPWTPAILQRFGLKVPMVWKRGYHLHFDMPRPSVPLIDAETSTAISPMQAGLRVLTGAHVTGLDRPTRERQIRRSTAAAQELLGTGPQIEPAPWHGNRPCLPRMLPIVGPAPGQPGMWLNFGHGHQGFTLGPTTGRLLAERMTGSAQEQDLMAALAFG